MNLQLSLKQPRYRWAKRWLWALWLIGALSLVLFTACTGGTETGATAVPDVEDPELTQQLPDEAVGYIGDATAVLASELNVSPEIIELESVTSPPDEEEGTYEVVLRVGTETYTFHGRNGEVQQVSGGLPPAADETATAVTPTEPAASPTSEPTTTAEEFTYNTALIDTVDILITETAAGREVIAQVSGNLRNGCEMLDETNVTQEGDTIVVELTTRTPVDMICTEALVPFVETIPLNDTLADLEAGGYQVVVNDAPATPLDWSPEGSLAEPQPLVTVNLVEGIATAVISTTIPASEANNQANANTNTSGSDDANANGNDNTNDNESTEMGDMPFWAVYPAHTAVTFEGYPVTDSLQEPTILVYPVERFSEMNEAARSIITTLRLQINDQVDLSTVDAHPFLPLVNAAQLFDARAEVLKFASGQGIRFLTQYGQGANPINNEELFYTFQGLTDDQQYYVSVVLPITHPDLPANATSETPPDDYEAYLADVIAQLDAAEPAAFTPDLAMLDEMVASIRVESAQNQAGGGETGQEPGGPALTHADFVRLLEDAGATVRISTEPVPGDDILSVPPEVINVNDGQVQLFIYEDADAASADAARIGANGYQIESVAGGTAVYEWIAPPHFYQLNNLLILYVGDDSEILAALESAAGAPFTGG